tara:strand:+ start:1205 stop:1471 length:267 start_codon:yes stop_codon:yes gene_type:complete
MSADLTNAIFEIGGGFLMWLNVKVLYESKEVKGVDWRVSAFFFCWGVWNIYYYPSLDQWLSFYAGIWLSIANLVWVSMAVYYGRKAND